MVKRKSILNIILGLIFSVSCFAQKPVGDNWLNIDNVPAEDAICFALYTVSDNTMKMTAQLYPFADDVDRVVKLQIQKDGNWETIAATIVSEEYYGWPQEYKKRWTAHFRVEQWNSSKDYQYRVLAAGDRAEYQGLIRKDPDEKEEIVIAAFTGNGNYDRRLKPDIIRNIKAQDPDLLFFSGDQSYDHERHLQAWLLFGQQFGEIIKDRPTICIPDDHDIGQGNIWGSLNGLGDYYDGFHNKITMYAYANPSEERKNKWGGEWGERAAGYGLVRLNTKNRKIEMEVWPRGIDVMAEDAEQYEGWPVTINQMDNYGREPIAYLPPIMVTGMENPVVQVIYESTKEIVYTVRIQGNQFQPKVFKDGKYTIKIGEKPDNMKILSDIDAQEDETNEKVINIEF